MKTPALEQLQGWTQLWDEAKRYQRYQKIIDQRMLPMSDEADLNEVMTEQAEPEQAAIDMKQIVDGLVKQVETRDQQEKHKAKNVKHSQVCEVIAGENIVTLKDELGRAIEDLGLEPPWSIGNIRSGLYRADQHVIPLAIRMLDGLRQSKVNQEKKLERHLNDCFDVAFCGTSEKSVAHLHALKERGATDIPCVMRVSSVESARILHAFAELDVPEIIETAKHAIKISSYGLLRVALNALEARGKYIDKKRSWSEMMKSALQRSDPSIIKQCLRIEKASQESWLKYADKTEPPWIYDLLTHSMQDDKEYGKMRSNEDRLQMILDCGIDVNAKNPYGGTALQEACRVRYETAVGQLIKAGADVNTNPGLYITTSSGKTALENACIAGHEGIVEKLIQAGADVNAYENGSTALIVACVYGHVAIVDKLIKAGADINASNDRGDSVLMLAIESGHEAVVWRLIDAGADINAQSNDKWTALMSASINGHEAVVDKLIEVGVDIHVKGMDTSAKADGIDIDATDVKNKGKTALLWASTYGYEGIVEKLMQAGADINTKNDHGDSALMIAVESGHDAVVEKLIEAKADISVTNNDGHTVFDYAKKSSNANIITLLKSIKLPGRASRLPAMPRASASVTATTTSRTQTNDAAKVTRFLGNLIGAVAARAGLRKPSP